MQTGINSSCAVCFFACTCLFVVRWLDSVSVSGSSFLLPFLAPCASPFSCIDLSVTRFTTLHSRTGFRTSSLSRNCLSRIFSPLRSTLSHSTYPPIVVSCCSRCISSCSFTPLPIMHVSFICSVTGLNSNPVYPIAIATDTDSELYKTCGGVCLAWGILGAYANSLTTSAAQIRRSFASLPLLPP